MENLRRHRELIEIRASLIQFQESRALRSNVNSAFEATKNTERNNKRLAVVSWLSAADSDLDQEASVAERLEHPGTGRWIFDKPEMKAWCDPDSTLVPALWLNGIPGAGNCYATLSRCISLIKYRENNFNICHCRRVQKVALHLSCIFLLQAS